MSAPHEWVWGTVTLALLQHAAKVAARMQQNVRTLALPQTRLSHTPDEWYQKLLGAEGELAFRALTCRPIPSVAAMVGTWKAADVDGFAIKTVAHAGHRLLFDDSDLAPATALVLMLNAKPRFAIVGRINVQDALRRRVWGAHLPRPAWMVEQQALDPWFE